MAIATAKADVSAILHEADSWPVMRYDENAAKARKFATGVRRVLLKLSSLEAELGGWRTTQKSLFSVILRASERGDDPAAVARMMSRAASKGEDGARSMLKEFQYLSEQLEGFAKISDDEHDLVLKQHEMLKEEATGKQIKYTCYLVATCSGSQWVALDAQTLCKEGEGCLETNLPQSELPA